MPQTRTILSRLVGSHFRRAGDLILENLPSGTSLILDPEPDNPYDSNAIKVMLSPTNIKLSEEDCERLPNFGITIEEIVETEELFHLGYIAKSGGKPADGLPGNVEVLDLMAGCPTYQSVLAFSPEGKPLVKISES